MSEQIKLPAAYAWATLGTPVVYERGMMDIVAPDAPAIGETWLKTQIISLPQHRYGKWCVLVAMVGDWVPIAELKRMNG